MCVYTAHSLYAILCINEQILVILEDLSHIFLILLFVNIHVLGPKYIIIPIFIKYLTILEWNLEILNTGYILMGCNIVIGEILAADLLYTWLKFLNKHTICWYL